MAQQISRDEWERKYGAGRMERPQPARIPGLPDPREVIAELAYLRQLEDAQPPADPGRLTRTALPRGSRSEGREADRAALQGRVAQELLRQQLLGQQAAELEPDQLLSAALGRPVDPGTAAVARAYLELPGGEPLSPAEAVALAERSGAARASAGSARAQQAADLADLAQIVAQKGEIGPDENIQQTLLAAYRGLIDPARPVEAQLAALSPQESAELALRARSLTQLQQLSAVDTAAAAQYLGAGRTIGGRRNAYRKERTGSAEASALRAPGNVLSAGLDFPQEDMLLPLLVAPKNQQVWASGGGREAPYSDVSGPAMQVAQYYAGKDEAGRSRFAPSLRDARVLYVNPYAELPAALVERLGLEPVLMPAEKDVSGAYDQEALNVPVPDRGEAANVLPPKADPAYRAEVAPVYRNPTLAEAVNALSLRYRTPIKAFTEDMLVNRGRDYQDFLVSQPDLPVYALGSKRDASGRPAPIAAYFEQPADPSAPAVASVRVGSGQKRSVEFYTALDDLVDALAGEVYGRPPVRAELSGADRYQPELGGTAPGETRYGALMNLRRADPMVAAYQRRLLEEAGFPVQAKGDNPLLGVVDLLEQLAGAPPADAPVAPVARAAAAAEPLVAPTGQTGAARLLARAKEPLLRTAAVERPTTDRSRQGAERAAAELLQRLLASPTAAQPRAEAPFSTRQLGLPEVAAAAAAAPPAPAPTPARPSAPAAPSPRPASTVVQYVPRELYDAFWRPSAPAAPLQQQAAAALRRAPERQLELGLPVPYSPTGFTPDPADALERYMARQAQTLPAPAGSADAALAGPGQPRPATLVQTSLGLERLAQQQRDQVIAEQASALPQSAATQTVEHSPLNAPPPPDTSPARQADALLRRYRTQLRP